DSSVDRSVLRCGSRDLQHAAFAKPDIVRQRANRGEDALTCACERQRAFVAERHARLREVGPVSVDEAPITPARPTTATVGFEQDNTRRRFALSYCERRPKTRVPAAHDAHVRWAGKAG